MPSSLYLKKKFKTIIFNLFRSVVEVFWSNFHCTRTICFTGRHDCCVRNIARDFMVIYILQQRSSMRYHNLLHTLIHYLTKYPVMTQPLDPFKPFAVRCRCAYLFLCLLSFERYYLVVVL